MTSSFRLLTLILIAVVALGLRVYELDRNPPEFFEDEIAAATSAWSITTTGHDVENTTLPFVRTRLVLQQPIYPFSVVPFWAVLGHTPFAERLPAAIFGTASVLLIVWLLRVLRRPAEEALLGGAIAAFLPWAVHFGRIGWEPAALTPFTIAGIGLLWIGLRDNRSLKTIAGVAVLALGAYTYIAGLFMHVLLAGVVVLIHRRRIKTQLVGLGTGVVLAAVVLVPFALAFREPLLMARAKRVSVFANGVGFDALKKAGTYYWWQWTPKGLFTANSFNLRDKPGSMLFWWMLPFLLIGVVKLAARRSDADLLLLGWLVLSPLPAALTYDGPVPNFARGTTRWPVIVMVTAIGVVGAWRAVGDLRFHRVWQPALVTLIAVAATYQTVTFYRDYFDLSRGYPARSAAWWYYGTGAALRAVRQDVPSGGTVCIDGVSYFTFPHYTAYYLGTRPPFTVVEGLSDGRCRSPGTYVLAHAEQRLGVPGRTLTAVTDLDRRPVFRLSVVLAAR